MRGYAPVTCLTQSRRTQNRKSARDIVLPYAERVLHSAKLSKPPLPRDTRGPSSITGHRTTRYVTSSRIPRWSRTDAPVSVVSVMRNVVR